MTVYYDDRFNQNEWFIIILLLVAYTVLFILPKRFPLLVSLLFVSYAITVGHFVDHTVSIPPFDFYDVNDVSDYEFFDFLTYVMYGPFSYFIIYFFDRFRLGKRHIILYVVLWSIVAVCLEWLGLQMGVYHYDKGWRIQFSFPSYLFIISILLILYYKLCRQKEQ